MISCNQRSHRHTMDIFTQKHGGLCPHAEDLVEGAVAQCPFLKRVSEKQGKDFAKNLALNPFSAINGVKEQGRSPEKAAHRPLFPEDEGHSFQVVMDLFHGPRGCVPLHDTNEGISDEQPEMPLMASMSLSGFSNLPNSAANMMRRLRSKRKQQQQKQKRQLKNSNQGGNAVSTNTGTGSSSSHVSVDKRQDGFITPPSHSRKENPSKYRHSSRGFSIGNFLSSSASGVIALGGAKQLQCPPAIVAMRAAVARMKAVRQLKPQALPIRALALSSVAISFNLPCGMLREHTKKFSPGWILAVHATVPFVAMLRKAVMMPTWGLGLTVVGSIIGQQIGSSIEKKRLRGEFSIRMPRPKDVAALPQTLVKSLLPDGHPASPAIKAC
ncbi:hypothetical protein PSENEW3n2_00003881 [Picochlorum sp. SENEW3]|nr:hypothetical protein PSENEW3n2_00003881 [Picochlorum sp. SENEW3]WPT18581.1 hypothetical protein PSENEW3_00003881 [Picochlorum sp. SENEW3]